MRTLSTTLILIYLLTTIPGSLSYSVSVVEYMYNYNEQLNPSENLMKNVAAHVNIIRLLKGKSELVVFPEDSLCPTSGPKAVSYFNIPNPSGATPQFSEKVLTKLSDAAKYSQMYVVLSLPERSGKNKYSTSFVLRRNGTIAARYRNYHLFKEDVDRPSKPDMTYFDTDFGIRFGLLTSLDIVFQSPAKDLIDQGIKYFVYPSSWTSAMPFLIGNQIQQSWSWAHDVTLLAAGLNRVNHGQTGSGIFRGKSGNLKSTMKYYMSNTPTTMIITGNLLNDNVNLGPQRLTGNQDSYNLERLFMRSQFISASLSRNYNQDVEKLATGSDVLTLSSLSFKPFKSELLVPDSKCTYMKTSSGSDFYRCDTQRHLCDGSICCDFDITVDYFICSPPCLARTLLPALNTDDSFYLFRYRMAVLDGVETPWKGGDTLGLQVCSIVSCLNSDVSSCGTKPNLDKYDTNVFNIGGHSSKIWAQSVTRVNITGYFTVNSSTMMLPSLFLGANEPSVHEFNRFGVLSNNFIFNTRNNVSQIYLPQESRNLGAVAIINRVFTRDGFPARGSQRRLSPSFAQTLIFSAAFFILYSKVFT